MTGIEVLHKHPFLTLHDILSASTARLDMSDTSLPSMLLQIET